MYRKDFVRMKKGIKESVEKTMESIPYEEIGKKVSRGVNRAGQKVERAGQRIREGYEQEERRRGRVKPARRKKNVREKIIKEKKGFFNRRKEEPILFTNKPRGRFIWFFLLLFGLLLGGAVGIMGIFTWLIEIVYGGGPVLSMEKNLVMWLLFGIGVFMAAYGNGIRTRLKRFKMYKKSLLGKEYCQLELLRKTTGKSVRYLKKDLKKMIDLGMFPQGHLDEQGTCLILTNWAYEQYMMMVESQMQQEKEAEEAAILKEQEERRKEEEENQRFADVDEGTRAEIKKIIKDGEFYLNRFETINDRLAGEVISKKLSRLSMVTGRIFEFITDHPEKVGDIRKFMSYYLPTTEKLLNTYEELDKELVQGENIMKAKREIEDTLDTINFAFENLLDSLYEDTRMDISTDIAVLETMLAQEGLTEQDF